MTPAPRVPSAVDETASASAAPAGEPTAPLIPRVQAVPPLPAPAAPLIPRVVAALEAADETPLRPTDVDAAVRWAFGARSAGAADVDLGTP